MAIVEPLHASEGAVGHVQFARVEKSFNRGSAVVKNLNLVVRRGEFLTMLGPSGSGKTTTLMMLAGFEHPSSGSILLDGRPIENLPPHKRGIGVVFQNYALFPHMTIEENVGFPLKMRNLSKTEISDRVKEALRMVRMDGMALRRPSQLSGGQQQRIALARALIFKPQLVLMDEPLGALDKQLREHMQLEIKQLHEELDVTIIYVTHDQGEALTMSDRVAVFSEGRIQQLGSPAEIYTSPINRFVASFIGDNNLIPVKVAEVLPGSCKAVPRDVVGPEEVVITAQNGGGLALNGLAYVAIRPEKIVIDPADNVTNRIRVTVQQVIYLGDHVRLQVMFGETVITLKIPNVDPAMSAMRAGAGINIGWNLVDCSALT